MSKVTALLTVFLIISFTAAYAIRTEPAAVDVITAENLETDESCAQAAGKVGCLKTDLTTDIDIVSTNPNADIDYIYSANP